VQALGNMAKTIYLWRKRALIDAGLLPGLTSIERAELVAARRRIRDLKTELAIHRRAIPAALLHRRRGTLQSLSVHFSPPNLFSFRAPPTPENENGWLTCSV